MIHHFFSGYVSNKSLFIIGLKKPHNPHSSMQQQILSSYFQDTQDV